MSGSITMTGVTGNATLSRLILDSAATIARRTIQLADPFEDMGGMLIRHLAWRVFEQEGDGSATAAVLRQRGRSARQNGR